MWNPLSAANEMMAETDFAVSINAARHAVRVEVSEPGHAGSFAVTITESDLPDAWFVDDTREDSPRYDDAFVIAIVEALAGFERLTPVRQAS